MTSIQINDRTAKALEQHAACLGLTIQEYLERHFGDANGINPIDDPDRWLDEVSEDGFDAPPLPANFSCRDIYSDHD